MSAEKLIILGSGPAGLTAAVYAARANLSPLIIEGKVPGGQLMSTTAVENWPGEVSILGPALMEKMREHALHFGTRFVTQEVTSVDLSKRPFELITQNQTGFTTHTLIIATGAQSRRLGCPGEDIFWGKGVSSCAVCDGTFYKDRRVVIVGGGDSGMESASFMTNFTTDITIVHILPELTASYAMQQRVLKNPNIKIIYESTVSAVGGETRVTHVELTHQKTGEKSTLPTDGVFVAIGLKPATALFKDQLELSPYGYIVLKNQTETSVPGVFAAGDVADSRYRQAITSAGSGCAASLDAERYLHEHGL